MHTQVACTLADLFGEAWFGQPPTTAVSSTAAGEPLLTSDPQFWQQALALQVRTLSIAFSRHASAADDPGAGDTPHPSPSHISSFVSIQHPLTGGFTFGQQVELMVAALAGSVEALERQLASLELQLASLEAEAPSPEMLGDAVTRAPVKPRDSPQDLDRLVSVSELITNGSSSSSSRVPGVSSAPPPLSDTDTAVPVVQSRDGAPAPALPAPALQQRSAALKRQVKRQSALLVAACAFHASPTARLARKLLDRLQLAALVEPSAPKAGPAGGEGVAGVHSSVGMLANSTPAPVQLLAPFEEGQGGTGAATVTAAEAAAANDEIARLREALQVSHLACQAGVCCDNKHEKQQQQAKMWGAPSRRQSGISAPAPPATPRAAELDTHHVVDRGCHQFPPSQARGSPGVWTFQSF